MKSKQGAARNMLRLEISGVGAKIKNFSTRRKRNAHNCFFEIFVLYKIIMIGTDWNNLPKLRT